MVEIAGAKPAQVNEAGGRVVVLETERRLLLDGISNLRDVGGYLTADGRYTRWRTLLRSGCVDRLSPAGQEWLIEAGLRTVIDLRENDEIATRPNVFADSARVRYRRVPVFDGLPPDELPMPLEVGYWRMLEQCQVRVRAVFETLLEPGALPALIQCHAGKDRTGMLVALILAAVGVPHTTVAADYALSATCLGPEVLDATRTWLAEHGWSWDDYGYLCGSPAELMLDVLAGVESRYGGVAEYLDSIGVRSGDLEALRELLTHDSPG
jgi:protein-tyrosine phosphatase